MTHTHKHCNIIQIDQMYTSHRVRTQYAYFNLGAMGFIITSDTTGTMGFVITSDATRHVQYGQVQVTQLQLAVSEHIQRIVFHHRQRNHATKEGG